MLNLKNSSKTNNKPARIDFNLKFEFNFSLKFKKNVDIMIMHSLEGETKNGFI